MIFFSMPNDSDKIPRYYDNLRFALGLGDIVLFDSGGRARIGVVDKLADKTVTVLLCDRVRSGWRSTNKRVAIGPFEEKPRRCSFPVTRINHTFGIIL